VFGGALLCGFLVFQGQVQDAIKLDDKIPPLLPANSKLKAVDNDKIHIIPFKVSSKECVLLS
jgi:hypothetical protein